MPRRAPKRDLAAARLILRGTRVFLRPPEEGDGDAFIALNRASLRLHGRRAHSARDRRRFAEFLARSRQANQASFLVFRADDGAVVGAVRITEIVRGNFGSAYLGYVIGAPFVDRGYMTEALQLVLRYAFRRLGLHRLEANIEPGNEASIALVRRAGFTREGFSRRYLKIGGRWRDHERWALLREDWRPVNAGRASAPRAKDLRGSSP